MSQTPAKTAASKTAAPEKPKRERAGAYLPALPKGWTYHTVIAVGPGGGQVTVDATDVVDNQYDVTVVADGIDKRSSTVGSLAEGAKAIQTGARALVKISDAEEAARQARQDALFALGKPEPKAESIPG